MSDRASREGRKVVTDNGLENWACEVVRRLWVIDATSTEARMLVELLRLAMERSPQLAAVVAEEKQKFGEM